GRVAHGARRRCGTHPRARERDRSPRWSRVCGPAEARIARGSLPQPSGWRRVRLIFTIARLTVLEMLRRRLFLVLLGLTLLVIAFTSWGFGQITTSANPPMSRVQQIAVVSQLLILVGFMFSFTLAFSAVFA